MQVWTQQPYVIHRLTCSVDTATKAKGVFRRGTVRALTTPNNSIAESRPSMKAKRAPGSAVLIFLLAVATISPFSVANASAPMRMTQPGYYRMMLGHFEVTALSDGTQPVPVEKLLTHVAPQQMRQDLNARFLSSPYDMSFTAFLVNTGSRLILIDTGAGNLLGDHLGKLVGHLEASGYSPNQVDAIYITHMHPDHIGGLSANGKAAFPNAVVRISQRESDFWLNRANLDRVPIDQRDYFRDAVVALTPYKRSGHFKPFSGDVELSPGIHAFALLGHTPGHTGYMIESDGKKMLVWGDVVHVAAVQFADPDAGIEWDVDGKEAKATRQGVLSDASRNGWLIAGAHLPFPGIGHVIKDGGAYQWLPVSYAEIHRKTNPRP